MRRRHLGDVIPKRAKNRDMEIERETARDGRADWRGRLLRIDGETLNAEIMLGSPCLAGRIRVASAFSFCGSGDPVGWQ